MSVSEKLLAVQQEECFKQEIRTRLDHDPRGIALELGVTMERIS